MLSNALLLLAMLSLSSSLAFREKRAAYDLPAGIVEQLGLKEVKKTFKCEQNGYFADIDNECKLFHICQDEGKRQSTLGCGLKQRFDQSKLTCNHEDSSIPCDASEDFFYLNERIGSEDTPFLGPADLDRAKNARPDLKAAKRAKRKSREEEEEVLRKLLFWFF